MAPTLFAILGLFVVGAGLITLVVYLRVKFKRDRTNRDEMIRWINNLDLNQIKQEIRLKALENVVAYPEPRDSPLTPREAPNVYERLRDA